MNLRVLKKLSKRAAPYLAKLGDSREIFASNERAGGIATLITERKHMRRWPRPKAINRVSDGPHDIVARRPGGGVTVFRQPSDPRKGTLMVGSMSGHETPEWDEEDCWQALRSIVFAHFTDWDLMEAGGSSSPARPLIQRDLSSPSMVFKAADELVSTRAIPKLG